MATATQNTTSQRTLQPNTIDPTVPLRAAESQDSALEPSHEEIALLAYSYWLDRQDPDQGSAEGDWLRAERDLRGR